MSLRRTKSGIISRVGSNSLYRPMQKFQYTGSNIHFQMYHFRSASPTNDLSKRSRSRTRSRSRSPESVKSAKSGNSPPTSRHSSVSRHFSRSRSRSKSHSISRSRSKSRSKSRSRHSSASSRHSSQEGRRSRSHSKSSRKQSPPSPKKRSSLSPEGGSSSHVAIPSTPASPDKEVDSDSCASGMSTPKNSAASFPKKNVSQVKVLKFVFLCLSS